MMTYAQASAIADSLSARDAGVLVYSVLSIGADCIVILCVCAKTGAVLGEV